MEYKRRRVSSALDDDSELVLIPNHIQSENNEVNTIKCHTIFFNKLISLLCFCNK